MSELCNVAPERLKEFAVQYNFAINDPDLVRRYRMIEDGKHDIATKIAVETEKARKIGEEIGEKRGEKIGQKRGEKIGQKRGEKIGEKKGAMKNNRENAKAFRDQGVDPVIISNVTGLSLSEIAEL